MQPNPEFLSNPDLQILYFSPTNFSLLLEEIIGSQFGSFDVLTHLKFAIKNLRIDKYVAPPPGMGAFLVHNHEPFILMDDPSLRQYRLLFGSLSAGITTLNFEELLLTYPKPWGVKIMVDKPLVPFSFEKGDFFDPDKLPKRISTITRY